MGKAARPVQELGNEYGKPDIERLGLFSEMPFMNGKGYVPMYEKPKRVKGKNLLAGGPKEKRDWQDCYFDKEFKRIYTGEALKGRGRKPLPSKFKNISERPFVPPGETKWHSTPGDWHGTFEGRIEAFSRKEKQRIPTKHEGPNATSRPGKQGGCGYVDICINPYPTHSVEKYGQKQKYKEYGKTLDGAMVLGMHPKPYFELNPYKDPDGMKPGPCYVPPKEKQLAPLPPGKLMPTGPGKKLGGCKAGCFEKYPEHKVDKYKTVYQMLKPRTGSMFILSTCREKSYYTCSVINENISFKMNESTYKSYKPNFIKYLL
ncbi:unnamed protein product [Ceutorhynchus assimilis]|uniref:Cilia-and flagella-associated protein 96 n=1 Tax=Ceutorhynchus assimilis TaxID=467358 RepID=A0A9N9MYA0_9CUCU|nr:unnamed protein product [Ceutorhynchus assimilis]